MSIPDVLSGARRWWVEVGDVLDVLRQLPDGCVHTCVTSPPYFQLRDYQTGEWSGGDSGCDHRKVKDAEKAVATSTLGGGKKTTGHLQEGLRACRCGATRVDQQIGLEPTVGEYVAKMVEVFRGVKRVLRDDGTLWLNLGDSYAANGVSGLAIKGSTSTLVGTANHAHTAQKKTVPAGLKPKDLIGMPWRVAFALQEDGWYLRSAITWCKKACMPESVTDRPTSATEMIFLLAKKPTYYFDQEAVKEAGSDDSHGGTPINSGPKYQDLRGDAGVLGVPAAGGRNLRNYWLLGPEPYANAHFATFVTEVPRRAILAGSSERGCCPAPGCGAPWRRVVERKGAALQAFYSGAGQHGSDNRRMMRNGQFVGEATTLGWEPTCAHGLEPVPCVVLDPFSGAGTTGLVALRLGRRYLGVELNPSYAEMSTRRILDDQGATAAEVGTVEQPVQLRLGVA